MYARVLSWACPVLVIALCSPQLAQARFGKASGGGGGGRGGSAPAAGARRSAPPAPRATTPIRSSPGVVIRPRARVWAGPRYRAPVYIGPAYYGYIAPAPLPPPPVVIEGEPPDEGIPPPPDMPAPIAVTLQGDVTLAGTGNLFGVGARFEGQAFGLALGYTGIFSPATDGTGDLDAFHLAHAHLTYALLSGPRGRIRAELGAHLASAPDITFFAPGGGISAVLRLVGGFGMEARVYGTYLPYTELDGRLGLVWSGGMATLLGGVRGLYLNDNGMLGAANAGDTSDSFVGPYLGLALAL